MGILQLFTFRVMKALLLVVMSLAVFENVSGQDDLMELADREMATTEPLAGQTFKGTRLINGHSVETRDRGVLDVIISHRFGRINSGAYEFFGLDESNVRLGVDYGITDRFNIGIGRNSFEKTYDGFLKYKILQQHQADGGSPISAVVFSSAALKTLRTGDPEGEPGLNSRMAYTFQAILARKISPALSLQIMPAWVHRNAVPEGVNENDLGVLGAGGRMKLTKRVSLNVEYFYIPNRDSQTRSHNPIAIGFDIETGGHVFQLHFTNARAMNEKGFMTETSGDFFDGDVHFGFNISRVFQIKE